MGQKHSKPSATPPRPPSPYTQAFEQAQVSAQQGATTQQAVTTEASSSLTSTFHHLTHPSTTTSEQIKLPLGRLPDADQASINCQASRDSRGTVRHNGENVKITRVRDPEEKLKREMRMRGYGGLGGYGGDGCRRLRGGNFITGQCYECAHRFLGCCITINSCGRY